MLTEARGLKFSDTMQYALYLSIPSNFIESPKYLLKEFIPLKGKIQSSGKLGTKVCVAFLMVRSKMTS